MSTDCIQGVLCLFNLLKVKMLLRSKFPMCKKSMFPQWAVAWSAFCTGSGMGLAHACCGLGEHPCFFSDVIYWAGVAVTGRILLSAIGLRADWLQDEALVSRLSSLCTIAGVVPFYLKVPKAVFPSQRLRHQEVNEHENMEWQWNGNPSVRSASLQYTGGTH